jgi:hypothetical protein
MYYTGKIIYSYFYHSYRLESRKKSALGTLFFYLTINQVIMI